MISKSSRTSSRRLVLLEVWTTIAPWTCKFLIVGAFFKNQNRVLSEFCIECDDRNWELLAPWQGSKITVPAKLMVGDKDIGFDSGGTREYIEGDIFKNLVPNNEVVILDGHHFIHQEKAQEVSQEILSFFQKFAVNWVTFSLMNTRIK